MTTDTVKQITHGLTLDDTDEIGTASHKLKALLLHTYGNSGESFRIMSNEMQDAYLWACSDIAEKIEALVNKMARVPAQQMHAVVNAADALVQSIPSK